MITGTTRPVAGRPTDGSIRRPGRPHRGRTQYDGDIRGRDRPWGLAHRFATLILLAYAGGAVMFSMHALIRGEKGPPISNLDHWLLDSTLGFIALAPAVLAGVAVLARHIRVGRPWFPVIAGLLFAIITTPGPMAHDRVVGEDTVGATIATHFCGLDQVVLMKEGVEHTPLSECLVQLLVGIPTYIGLFFVAWWIGRVVRARRGPSAPSDHLLVLD